MNSANKIGLNGNPSVVSLIGALLFYLIFSAIIMGANPFRGETTAPMDVLLAQNGWKSSVTSSLPMTHPERSDVLDSILPQWVELKKDIRSGGDGLWNPLSSGGRPGILDFTQAELTPSFLLFYLFDDDWLGFYFAGLIKLIIAGVGMYLFLRLFMGGGAALFGGAVYSVIGFHSAWFYWPHVSTSAWIPWVLWSISGWFIFLKARWCLLIVFSTAMLILGGMPVVAAYGLYAAMFLAVLLPIVLKQSIRAAGIGFIVTLCAIGLAFLVVAIPVLGFHEVLTSFISLEVRQAHVGSALNFETGYRLLLSPYADGLPRVEKTLYVGKIALLLAAITVVALMFGRLHTKELKGVTYFGLVLLVASLGIAFVWLPAGFIQSLPAIGSSLLSRIVVITGLSIAILAAVALHLSLQRCQAIGPVALRRIVLSLLFGVVLVQLYDQARLFRRFNAVVTSEQFLPGTPSLDFVQKNLSDLQSVIADSSYLVSGTLGAYGIPEWFAHEFKSNVEKEQLGKLVKSPFVTTTAASFNGGAIRFDSPLFDKFGVAYLLIDSNDIDYSSLRKQSFGGHRPAPPMPNNQLSQLIEIENEVRLDAVSVVFATYGAEKAPSDVILDIKDRTGRAIAKSTLDARKIQDNQKAIFKFDKPVTLHSGSYALQIRLKTTTNQGSLTVWYVENPANKNDSISINGDVRQGAILYELLESNAASNVNWDIYDFEPGIKVLRNKNVPRGAYFVRSLSEVADWDDSHVKTIREGSASLRLEYSGSESGYVVLPMRRFSGWGAFVGGKEQEVSSYLGVLPAIRVDGQSVVEFKYAPPWIGKGVMLTITGLLFLILLLYVVRMWGRQEEVAKINKMELQ